MNFRQVALSIAAAYGGYAVVNGAFTTGTGNHDFTVPGFGVPSAAIGVISHCTAYDTATAHIASSIFIFDGTNVVTVAGRVEDNAGTSSTARRFDNASVYKKNAGGGADMIGAPSLITDGLRINVSDAAAAAYKITVLLIRGVQANVAYMDLPTSGTVSKTGLPFAPSFLYCLGAGTGNTLNTNNADFSMEVGYAAKGGAQGCVANYSADAAGDVRNLARNDAAMVRIATSATQYWTVAFNSDGYIWTPNGSPSAVKTVGVLALRPDNAHGELITTPAGTGDVNYTNAGFMPSALVASPGCATALSTAQTASGGPALGLFANAVAGCMACCDWNGAGTSDAWSYHSATQYAWNADEVSSTKTNAKATAAAVLPTGETLNWNTAGVSGNYMAQAMLA